MQSDSLFLPIPLLVLLLAGCSTGNFSPTLCQVSADCRDGFGFGWTCGDAGFCTEVDVPERCKETYPDDLFTRPENYADAIVLGSLFDHVAARDNLLSIELAIDEANIEGGLNGRSFVLASCNYTEDIAFDNDDSETAARNLTTWMHLELGVQVVLGPGSSPKVEQIWDLTQDAGILLVSPSATSDRLIEIDGATSTDQAPGLFWRTAPPDRYQVGAIIADMNTRGVASVAIIHQTGSYGEGILDGLNLGLASTVQRVVFSFDNSNELTAAIAHGSDVAVDEVVFISSDPSDVSAFLNGANASGGYTHKGLFLTDTARDAAVLQNASNAEPLFPNIRGSIPVPDPTLSRSLESIFNLSYSQRYGVDATLDGFSTFSYDAAWIALYGIAYSTAQEPTLSGTGVARGLRQLSSPIGLAVPIRASSWLEVVDALEGGDPIDVFGASGSLDFDSSTGETANPIAIWTVERQGDDVVFVNEDLCLVGQSCVPFPSP